MDELRAILTEMEAAQRRRFARSATSFFDLLLNRRFTSNMLPLWTQSPTILDEFDSRLG